MELLPNGIAESVGKRMNQLIEAIQSNYPAPIEMAFASQLGGFDSGAQDEGRFDSLWIFAGRYFGEIRNPLASGQKLNFDVAILSDKVDYIRLGSQDFDLQKATEKSQFSIEFSTADGVNGTISAIGTGCDDLLRIYHERFAVNLYKN